MFFDAYWKQNNYRSHKAVSMVYWLSVFGSSAVYRGFEPRSGQIKDYEIGICCFSFRHAALRSTSNDRLARNQNNVSEWNEMSTREQLLL
jgi:hypothetical protein